MSLRILSSLAILLVCFVSLAFNAQAQCHNLDRLYAELEPSVVFIKSEYVLQNPLTKDSRRALITGSGSFVTEDGLILSTDHLFYPHFRPYFAFENYNLEKTTVLYKNKLYKAKLLSLDKEFSYALLRIENLNNEVFPALKLGNIEKLALGDCIFSIGNPLIFKKVLKTSIAGGITNLSMGDYDQSIYTPGIFLLSIIALNNSDSGGPVFNQHGELIGINTYITKVSLSAVVLIDETIQNSIRHAINSKSLERSTFKCTFNFNDHPDLSLWKEFLMEADEVAKRKELKLPESLSSGVVLHKPGQIGFKDKDVVVEFRDNPITSLHDFLKSVSRVPPGTSVKFKVFREGQLVEFHTVLDTIKIVTP